MEELSCKAELVDVVRESQLWGEHYNRKFTIPYALTLAFKAFCGVLDCHNDSKKDTGVGVCGLGELLESCLTGSSVIAATFPISALGLSRCRGGRGSV